MAKIVFAEHHAESRAFTERLTASDAPDTARHVTDVDAWLASVHDLFGIEITLSDDERRRLTAILPA